jgi:hypothetical protein
VDLRDEPDAVHLTPDEFAKLIDAGVLDGTIELLGGRVIFGRYAAAFSAAQLGIDVRPGAGQTQ